MAHRHKVQKFNVGGAAVAYGNQDVISAAKKGGTNPGIRHCRAGWAKVSAAPLMKARMTMNSMRIVPVSTRTTNVAA